MGFSESCNTEPIDPNYRCPDRIDPVVPCPSFDPNPDYMPPTAEITFEVEYDVDGLWVKHRFARGTYTDDEKVAHDSRSYYEKMLFKTRIIRVETIRSQLP